MKNTEAMAATDTETKLFTPLPEGQDGEKAAAGEEKTLILATSAQDEPIKERVARGVSAKHVSSGGPSVPPS